MLLVESGGALRASPSLDAAAQLLDEEIKGGVHALSIVAKTPAEGA